MTGLTPVPLVALKSWIAPAIDPWSVSETAGISNSAARAASSGIRQAPSRIEYSEWTWRWTNGASGTGWTVYDPVQTCLLGDQFGLRGGVGQLPVGCEERRLQGVRENEIAGVVDRHTLSQCPFLGRNRELAAPESRA